ncbi:GNAT family N-acetyltransferase [Pseudoalteromonas sp. NZS71_1]|uniref:GNAT family N-acetyltransferase n=1 Tax=Pseudoalteromonas sp. NZS71_1 TaxID=2792072 RepID=UPI0018CCA073|nr:GNAT family N-acetyltransferase [Pseudoalteromonas sp. NZS71_1]MBH0033676.1 GNAT family N-acetyltransferase [Pseudoalteromonas sp. NZS71_1]
MQFKCEQFDAFDTQTLFTIMRGRVDVFVVEQKCPYPELDDVDIDLNTQHLYTLDNGRLHTYARCYEKNEQYSAIGRVLVSKSARGKGDATLLVSKAIDCCKERWPERDIYIGAQTYLLDFYRSFGFEDYKSEYLEDGIPHQDMILKLAK